MAISKRERDEWTEAIPNTDEVRDEERQTSISAHTVRSISVNMSMMEMDTLVGSFGRDRDQLSVGEKTVQDEFVREVERVRFAQR